MPPRMNATFVPGGVDDYNMPEVVAPSPQRVTPQVPQNMQDDLQRLELEAYNTGSNYPNHPNNDASSPSSIYSPQVSRKPTFGVTSTGASAAAPSSTSYGDIASHSTNKAPDMSRSADAPSFTPFPKVKGDNIPPNDEEKEEILWNAREHVLHSNNVSMQLSWARDTLAWIEIVQEAAARENGGQGRPETPQVEHTLRLDATSIVDYLCQQEHPEALFMKAKWLEFGKFGVRQDRKEAYNGYKRAAGLGYPRAEYRMGMLYESSNDYTAAVEHYYAGMRQKDSAALYRLGMMSLLGQHGQPKDYQRGLKLINDAADSADEDAPQGAYVYGMLLSRELPEISVPEALLPYDMARARMYLEKAAYLGFAKAQLKMGQAYELCQLGCDFNPAYSIHYYGLASKQGQPEASLGVSRWFLFGYEGVFTKNESLAFRYAKEAADAKLATGEFAMGYYHEIGIHVPKDLQQARTWYELAADHGNKDAVDRLESLKMSRSLSKNDHETTTLTRIKSQHGSQRGKRPDRFKQPNKAMPTLSEGTPPSPLDRQPSPRANPSPRAHPVQVQDGLDYPDPSSASVHGRQPAFGLNVDPNHPPPRSQSAAPYPEDDRSAPGNFRSASAAPYPEDDVAGRHHGGRGAPGPAFGVRPGSSQGDPSGRGAPYGDGIRGSQSMANLVPAGTDPRSRPPPGPGYRQPSPGPAGYGGRGGQYGPGPNPQNKPATFGPGPNGPGPRNHGNSTPSAQGGPGQGYGARSSSRPTPPPGGHAPPAAAGRVSSMQSNQSGPPAMGPRPGSARPDLADPGPNRVGSAPPASQTRPGAPPKPAKQASQGPATFEEMGIPQGKSDDQCVVM